MAKFPFTDLHGFKDYVVFVQICAPDQFPRREGLAEADQWSLDLAFEGLRQGLALVEREKDGQYQATASKCRELMEAAYAEYSAGQRKPAFLKLEDVRKMLNKIPSQ
jgi:hypothetical protein